MSERLAKCEAQIANLQQYAKVIRIHEDANLVDVVARDTELTNIPYVTGRAGSIGKTFWMPEVNEVGLLLSPGGDVGNAIFMPALNYNGRPAPRNDKDIMLRQFDPEAREEWNGDNDTHTLRISGDTEIKIERSPGKIEAKAGSAKATLHEPDSASLEYTTNTKTTLTSSQHESKAGNAKLTLNDSPKVTLQTSGLVKTEMTSAEHRSQAGIHKIIIQQSGDIIIEYSPTNKITLGASGISIICPDINILTASFRWNGTPTTPIAWVATT